jgi:translation initiation factor 4G
LISGQPSLVNAAAAPPFSPAFLTSPQPTPAALPQYHNQFSSPVPQRIPAAQSPFSLGAGAAEFRPSPKRTSAAIRIVNPKDVSSPLKPAPAFTPKEVAAVVEINGNSAAEEARKIEEARSVEESKKADDERVAKEAAVASEAKAKVATEAIAAAAVAAAVAVKAEADQAESERLSKAQAEQEAADDARLAAERIATADAAIAASAAVADAISLDSSAADKVKKDAPAALDLEAIKSATTPAAALPSALLAARVIDNLSAVTYPADIKSPRPDLNVDAEPGKFRYDRDFLLQFMAVCQEKPEQLPNLEAIGMVDAGVGGNNSQGGFRRSSASMGPPALPGRGAAAGGFGGARTASMGQFSGGMGNFGGSGLSSEDRFKASLPGGSRSSSSGGFPARTGGSMSRTSSQPGTMASGGNFAAGNGPQGARIRSNRGKPRGHEGGGGGGNKPGQHTTGQGFEDAAPLEATANRWTPTVVGGTGAVVAAPDSPEMVQRKVKALLNKLTLERFESISEQILAWANKSEEEEDGRILRQVIALIFEKATDEANWSAMYAQLCRKLNETVSNNVTDLAVKGPDGKLLAGGSLFRKYLLNRCQEDYESGWKQKEVAAAAAASKADDDNAKKGANEAAKEKEEEEAEAGVEASSSAPKEAELLSDEYYAAQKAKRRGLGLVRFIGELYRLQMLTERIMHECIKKLLANVDNPDEEDIESLCRLLTTVGKMLDNVKAKSHLDVYFLRMSQMVENMKISSRIRFMLQVS